MAFSTQKDFFHVPFMNDTVEFECKRECVKLKSYESTIDERAWARDEGAQSKFLSDLVTCQTPVEGADGAGVGGGGRGGGAGGLAGAANPTADAFLAKFGIDPGDSVLEMTNDTFAKMHELLVQNKCLADDLEESKSQLKNTREENEKIKNIVQRKYDSNFTKEFYNKIQKLQSTGKISKTDEDELLRIYCMADSNTKAYEVVSAENKYLKRLIVKLSRRANIEKIKIEPERSQDVNYLQCECNKLRQELQMLRKFEDEKIGTQVNATNNRFSDKDSENIKQIIKDRNELRERVRDIHDRFLQQQKKAKDADCRTADLSTNLTDQHKYIKQLECKMQCMQKHYEEILQEAKYHKQVMECKMREIMCKAKAEEQKVIDCEREVACLRNQLRAKDQAINDYDIQYKQLIYKLRKFEKNGYHFKCPCCNLSDQDTC